MGSHESYTNVKNLLQRWVILPVVLYGKNTVNIWNKIEFKIDTW